MLWIALLTCCVLAGWLKASQNRKARQQYEAARIGRQEEAAQLYALGQATGRHVTAMFSNGLDGQKPISRQRVERELNEGRPFSLRQDENGRLSTTWIDPESGRSFQLRFRDDIWTGYATHWGSDANLPPVPPVQTIYQDGRELVRKLAVGYGPLLWLLTLLLLAVLAALRAELRIAGLRPYADGLQAHSQFLADALVLLAIVCTLAWLVNPHYSITFKGVTSNDNLAWGGMMLALSILVLAAVSPAGVRDPARATGRWQYSLRALLMLTTLCAVTFALAPYGYVVAIFALGGGAWYVLARALLGRRPA